MTRHAASVLIDTYSNTGFVEQLASSQSVEVLMRVSDVDAEIEIAERKRERTA
jgi:hypothetical protein